MFDVILDIKDLSTEALIARMRAIKTGAAGQVAFSSISEELTDLAALTDALEEKQQAITLAQAAVAQKILERDAAEAALITAANVVAQEVGRLAPDKATVAAADLRVRGKAGSRPVPAKPAALEVSAGDEEGEVRGKCQSQPGLVDFYERRWTTGDPNAAASAWTASETSKKRSFELNGLPTGQKIWVQVRACNTRGRSPWSDPACVRVP